MRVVKTADVYAAMRQDQKEGLPDECYGWWYHVIVHVERKLREEAEQKTTKARLKKRAQRARKRAVA